MKKVILIFIAVILSFSFLYFYNKDEELPVNYLHASYVIDVESFDELYNSADYVFMAKVESISSVTTYINEYTKTNDFGKTVTYADPLTEYTLNITDSYKGDLAGQTTVYKDGGISYDRKYINLYEEDFFPLPNETYLFFAYAQANGSILVSGKNSNTAVADINSLFPSQTIIKSIKE